MILQKVKTQHRNHTRNFAEKFYSPHELCSRITMATKSAEKKIEFQKERRILIKEKWVLDSPNQEYATVARK